MKRFAELFRQLDKTNSTNERIDFLRSYFETAPDEDKIWALALFTGRRPPRQIRTRQIQEWAMEISGIPEWLFHESYSSVGDLAETISLLLPSSEDTSGKTLADWFTYFLQFKSADDSTKKELIVSAWRSLSSFEIFVFNKLLMGSFRIGVSQTLVIRALGQAVNMDPAILTHRIMGSWDPYATTFDELILADHSNDRISQPYPFFLAYAIEGDPAGLGKEEDWFAEWKWDGIRSQIIHRNGQLYIWSRGEDLLTDKFPEFRQIENSLPEGLVLDGEIVCYKEGRPMPFNILQTRISRKNVTKKILSEAPVSFF